MIIVVHRPLWVVIAVILNEVRGLKCILEIIGGYFLLWSCSLQDKEYIWLTMDWPKDCEVHSTNDLTPWLAGVLLHATCFWQSRGKNSPGSLWWHQKMHCSKKVLCLQYNSTFPLIIKVHTAVLTSSWSLFSLFIPKLNLTLVTDIWGILDSSLQSEWTLLRHRRDIPLQLLSWDQGLFFCTDLV